VGAGTVAPNLHDPVSLRRVDGLEEIDGTPVVDFKTMLGQVDDR
jgi:tRNA (Thr-GGU) A37 N-methylase